MMILVVLNAWCIGWVAMVKVMVTCLVVCVGTVAGMAILVFKEGTDENIN